MEGEGRWMEEGGQSTALMMCDSPTNRFFFVNDSAHTRFLSSDETVLFVFHLMSSHGGL